jgi:hypothetical protein
MARRPDPRRPHGVSREAWGAVHPLLDLHGATGDEARRRAEVWLRDRCTDGVRTVVVVTGRGRHSGGFPVLRGEIEDLLRGLKGTLVAEFSLVSGGGGFRVELRREVRREAISRPASPPAILRNADPGLLRRAHEALWELGVTPTPALLQAEMRRLLREGGGEAP